MAAREPSRFEESHPLRMFPTFVWRGEVAAQTRDPLNAGMVGALDEMRGGAPAPGAAWQSDQALHEHDTFGELVACVDEAAAAALAHLKIGHDGFAITACWANVNAPGAGHAMHSHPNNLLSGIYYVTAPVGADTVNFHDPRPQTAIMRPPVTELTADNTDQVVRPSERRHVARLPRLGCSTRSTPTGAARRASASVSTSCSRPTRNG